VLAGVIKIAHRDDRIRVGGLFKGGNLLRSQWATLQVKRMHRCLRQSARSLPQAVRSWGGPSDL
jgi:hypothetical protein